MNYYNFSVKWDWKSFCGTTETLPFWNPQYRDLDTCFQHVFLQLPVLFLIAFFSSYYNSSLSRRVQRSKRDLWILRFRYTFTLFLVVSPIVRVYLAVYYFPGRLHEVDFLMAGVECLTWLVHFFYISTLFHSWAPSIRGPIKLSVLWAANYTLCIIQLHSHYIVFADRQVPFDPLAKLVLIFSAVDTAFQTLYLLTLVPANRFQPQINFQPCIQSRFSEDTPLLGSYSRHFEDGNHTYLGAAYEGWSFRSRLFFHWVGSLMDKGSAGKVRSIEDIYELPSSLTTSHLGMKLKRALEEKTRRPSDLNRPLSLLSALHSSFWKEFYGVGILKLIADLSGFCGPLLLHALVTFIETKDEPIDRGLLYALGLFLVSLTNAICIPHFNFWMSTVALKIRGAVVSTLYRKLLSLNTLALSEFSSGEVFNFMTTDIDRIMNSCASFHAFWSIPFQIAVALYLLYQQVGISFLAGLAFSIILIPINKCLASQIGKWSTKMMTFKDKRLSMLSEILRGIKAVKFYVWEDYFIAGISEIRKHELKYLGGRKYLDAMCVYFWATTPVLISIMTFVCYTLFGHKLTAPVVFTSIALLNMLISPLNAFPWVLNGLTEAWVSIKRVQQLLTWPGVSLEDYYTSLPYGTDKRTCLMIKDGTFYWWGGTMLLYQINLTVKEGQLVGVIGQVGSGKSSLLKAMLGESEMTSGFIAVDNRHGIGFGYVSQNPWLQRGTVRDNILFGEPYNQRKYWAIIEACALLTDLDALPDRDFTEVGEDGSKLSGGQKARVALARAVYQDHLVYLLDDVLSAVDPPVAKHIFNHCICGVLKKKTRILVTHQTNLLVNADHIVTLQSGRIVKQGPPCIVLPDYIDMVSSDGSTQSEEISLSCNSELHLKELPLKESPTNPEHMVLGSLEWGTCGRYLLSIGPFTVLLIITSMFLMQGSRNLVDWWLAYWVSNFNSTTGNLTLPIEVSDGAEKNTMFFLVVYASIGAFNSLFTLMRAFLFAYGGLKAAKKIHKNLLHKVIKASVVFFDATPFGRIINRFSSDVYTIDDSLPFIMNILLAQFFAVFGSIVMTLYGLPWLCLILTPIVPIYLWLQGHYRITSRELKRLSSVTLSPLYNHFNETLSGLPTIKAFKATSRFNRDNSCWLEANQKAQLCSNAASQWLAIRLQLIGVAVITGVGFIAVIQHHLDVVNPGLVGLAISYALSLTSSLGGVVSAFTETEREMVSVERVGSYLNSELQESPKEEANTGIISPPFAWPSMGVVSFNNVYLRYRDHLPCSLSGVTFRTLPAERIGVVGRTGAGKSSLIAALFRLTEISKGTIFIDNVNTKLLGLSDLRKRLGIIPQEPFVFDGSIKENLDPEDVYADADLWSAIDKAHLGETISHLGGLTACITKNTLSSGQNQLLCLARAILHSAKVVCIDEATSNVDDETDRLIQEVIRYCFRQSTVLTIAHRVRTVLDSDRVLVLMDGRVVEFDAPSVLLKDSNSIFHQLATENVQ